MRQHCTAHPATSPRPCPAPHPAVGAPEPLTLCRFFKPTRDLFGGLARDNLWQILEDTFCPITADLLDTGGVGFEFKHVSAGDPGQIDIFFKVPHSAPVLRAMVNCTGGGAAAGDCPVLDSSPHWRGLHGWFARLLEHRSGERGESDASRWSTATWLEYDMDTERGIIDPLPAVLLEHDTMPTMEQHFAGPALDLYLEPFGQRLDADLAIVLEQVVHMMPQYGANLWVAALFHSRLGHDGEGLLDTSRVRLCVTFRAKGKRNARTPSWRYASLCPPAHRRVGPRAVVRTMTASATGAHAICGVIALARLLSHRYSPHSAMVEFLRVLEWDGNMDAFRALKPLLPAAGGLSARCSGDLHTPHRACFSSPESSARATYIGCPPVGASWAVGL